MDIFDQYIFDELVSEYNRPDLTDDDYEEMYIRFCNIEHLEEVQPYLKTMRFFGLGTPAERDTVLNELKEALNGEDYILKGLYYDLLLSEDNDNTDALENLRQMVDEGYTDVFTKERTHIVKSQASDTSGKPEPSAAADKPQKNDEDVVVDYITFECNGYSGIYFTAGDTDYLAAKVYIKPFHGRKHIKVRSQIFLNGNSFSDVFSNEYDIDTTTRWLKTTGWGNTSCSCYRDNTYKWVIEIDGKTTFSQEFRMYNGRINKVGPKVNDVRLFASRWSETLEKDRNNYSTIFEGGALECVYFKFLIDPPGETMYAQVFVKVVYLEDGSVFRDFYNLHVINYDYYSIWTGIGFQKPGNWKKGLYQYLVNIGNGPKFEGTFTVS